MAHITRLVLVRHGASRSTEIETVGGHIGCRGLSAEGVLESERLSRRWLRDPPFDEELPFGGAYSSSMRRSGETANIVLSVLGLELDGSSCDLCEIHPGVTDGLSWNVVAEEFGSIDVFGEPDEPIAPAAESWNQMRDRVAGFLVQLTKRHRDKTVLIFTHKGVVDATVETWLEVSPRSFGGVKNTGITVWLVKTEDDGSMSSQLVTYGDFAHLEP